MSAQEPSGLSDEAKQKAVSAIEKHLNPKDEIHFFDPYLSVISPPTSHTRNEGGYKQWPTEPLSRTPDVKLMTMGNSTSLLPAYPWATEMGEALTKPDRLVEIWHGAGKGNTSSQELMRVLRDAPVIKPDMIISLSGICDIGYLLNDPAHPHLHKYNKRIIKHAHDAGLIARRPEYGPRDQSSPAEVWCRNQRFARVLADEMGINMITFLQPVQGHKNYPWTDAEKAEFEKKGAVILRGSNMPYAEAVTAFYAGVQEIMDKNPMDFDHVIDITDVFDDCPGAYRDHRHQTSVGVSHLAKRITPIVEAAISKGHSS